MEEWDDEPGIKVRDSVFSGLMYPESTEDLKAFVDACVRRCPPQRMDARLVVCPHACYAFSGRLQARALMASRSRAVRRVIIVAPYHAGESERIFLPESDFFSSPLGNVEIDEDMVTRLASCSPLFVRDDIPHFEEHSIELQLPFLRRIYPDAKLVPIVMGSASLPCRQALAQACDICLSGGWEHDLFIISSNLCQAKSQELAETRTREFLECVRKGKGEDCLGFLNEDKGAVCGAAIIGAILTTKIFSDMVMEALELSDSSRILDDSPLLTPPDFFEREEGGEIVSYGALAFYEDSYGAFGI